jgi:hypothetical protein
MRNDPHSSDSLSQRMILYKYRKTMPRQRWSMHHPAMFVAMGFACFACSLAIQILIFSA